MFQKIRGKKSFEDLDEKDKAKLAMALDSDGTLAPAFDNRRNYSHPVFEFAGSSRLPALLAEKYGKATTIRKTKTETGWVYKWQISQQNELEVFLQQIRPYIILKKRQIGTALEMLEVLENKPKGWKDRLNKLAKKLSKQNKEYKNPDIDLAEEFKNRIRKDRSGKTANES